MLGRKPSRWLTLALGALLLVSIPPWSAAAQASPVRVVQSGDGTLYLAQPTSARTVVPTPISDDDLAGLIPSGEIDGVIPASLLGASQDPTVVHVVQADDGSLYVAQDGRAWILVPDAISDSDLAALTGPPAQPPAPPVASAPAQSAPSQCYQFVSTPVSGTTFTFTLRYAGLPAPKIVPNPYGAQWFLTAYNSTPLPTVTLSRNGTTVYSSVNIASASMEHAAGRNEYLFGALIGVRIQLIGPSTAIDRLLPPTLPPLASFTSTEFVVSYSSLLQNAFVDAKVASISSVCPPTVNVFIGGGLDSMHNHTMYNYLNNDFAKRYPELTTVYKTHDDDIAAFVRSLPSGSRVNIVGHGWGADTAARAGETLGSKLWKSILLITLDPVTKTGDVPPVFNDVWRNIIPWVDVNALCDTTDSTGCSPSGTAPWDKGPAGYATYVEAHCSHADVACLMRASNQQGETAEQALLDFNR